MAGISSKALSFGDPKNKEKTFQGQRFDDELGLNWIQFKWRNHDPQIGRFIEIDPLSEKYEYNSTYAFSENRVINAIELEGLEAVLITNTYDKDGKLTNTSIINNSQKIMVHWAMALIQSIKVLMEHLLNHFNQGKEIL